MHKRSFAKCEESGPRMRRLHKQDRDKRSVDARTEQHCKLVSSCSFQFGTCTHLPPPPLAVLAAAPPAVGAGLGAGAEAGVSPRSALSSFSPPSFFSRFFPLFSLPLAPLLSRSRSRSFPVLLRPLFFSAPVASGTTAYATPLLLPDLERRFPPALANATPSSTSPRISVQNA